MPDNSIRLALLNFCDKQRGGVKIKYANDNSCQRDGSRWLVHWSFNMFFSGERAAFPHKARNQNTKRHNKSQTETWRFQRHTVILLRRKSAILATKKVLYTHVFPRKVWIFKHQRSIVMLINCSSVKMKFLSSMTGKRSFTKKQGITVTKRSAEEKNKF